MTTTQGLSRAENRAHLRHRAEGLLRDGTAAAAEIGGGALGVDALELLYRRASNPEFAADALKLLHELQTHQVELDLLLAQIQASENELTDELIYYKALYQCAPAAYLVVGRDGQVIESNDAADSLFGFIPDHFHGQTLTQYLAPEGRKDLATMMQTRDLSGSAATCLVRLADKPDCQLSVSASPGPSDDSILMVLSSVPTPDVV